MNFKIGKVGEVRIVPVLKDEIINEYKELMEYLKEKEIFTGNKGQIYSDISFKGSNVILVGMGEEEKVTLEDVRLSYNKVSKELVAKKVSKATLLHKRYKSLCYRKTIMAIVEGMLNAEYTWNKYKTDAKEAFKIEEIGLELTVSGKDDKIMSGVEEMINLQEGIVLTRDLVNEPAEYLYPETLANIAKEELEPLGVEVEILGQKEIEALNMHAYLAVARGSNKEPKFIIMRYNGAKSSEDRVGLVGKGLTYDSGGYGIKTTQGMSTMHTDMGGSGAVIGTMKAIAKNKLEKNVTAVVAACENMIDGGAYKNGDILKTMQGKTVEVLSTDAEGRLTLADALYYIVTKESVKEVVDVATLTGAVIMALGAHYIGAVTNNQDTMDRLKKASEIGGEKVWQLPADDDYREMIKSERADLKNSVPGGAGSITAGLFLENFVENTPWVHLDIAGVCSNPQKGYRAAGATGWPTKTLYYFVKENDSCNKDGSNCHH